MKTTPTTPDATQTISKRPKNGFPMERACAIRWCSRQSASILGKGTGYEFDVCQEHLDAAIGIPANESYERSIKEVLDGR